MKNKKMFIKSLGALLIVSIITTGCGKEVTLKNGEKAVATVKSGKVSSDSLYKKLKDKYGINVLVDLIDHELFDEKYKTDDKETDKVNSQIDQIKADYNGDEETYLAAIQSYFGAKDEEDLKSMLSLEYKRQLAVKDFLADNIKDSEVEDYYNENVIGEITAKHILIKPEVTEDMSSEDEEKAENEALEEAKKIIKKLDEGADFEELAKEYSDDTGSAASGGSLEAFDHNSNMDEDFLEAAKELEEKTYSKEPVKTQFGYHIIYKEKQAKKPKLKKVKEDIIDQLAEEKFQNDRAVYYSTLEEIRKENGLKFQDDELEKDYDEYMLKLLESVN